MNRPVRDPYAGWCERRTVGLWLTAVYSIGRSIFYSLLAIIIVLLICNTSSISILNISIFFVVGTNGIALVSSKSGFE